MAARRRAIRATCRARPVFVEGWRLGKPDIVIDIGEDFRVKPGQDAYEHFVVPTNFTEGKWIRAAEIRPGNRKVVHHVHVSVLADAGAAGSTSIEAMTALNSFLIRDGKLTRVRMDAPVVDNACAADAPELPYLRGFQEGALASFLPGRAPDVFPDGSAKWIPPGSKFEFVIHYARTSGPPQTDRTSVGLYLAPSPPERVLRRMDLRNFFFRIPPGAASHEVKRCYTFERDKLLLSITPHMHYRAHDVTYELIRPGGKHETLLVVPHYDFNWQLVYRLKEPLYVEKDSRLDGDRPLRQQPQQSRQPRCLRNHSLGRQKRRRNDDQLDRIFRRAGQISVFSMKQALIGVNHWRRVST